MPASTYIYIAKYPQLENLILSFHLTFNKSKPIAQMKSGNDYRIITIILQFSQKCKRNVQFYICNHQHFHCATSKSLYKAKTFIVITLGEYHHTLKTHFGLGYKKNNLEQIF